MSNLDKLQSKLRDRGLDLTDEQAEAMAVRLAGSVDAYLAELDANDQVSAEPIKAPPEGVSDKFSEPLGYEVNPPE